MEYLAIYLVSVVLSAYLVYVLSERVREYPNIPSFIVLVLVPLFNTVTGILLSLILLGMIVHEKWSKPIRDVESLLKTIFRHKEK